MRARRAIKELQEIYDKSGCVHEEGYQAVEAAKSALKKTDTTKTQTAHKNY